MKHIYDQPQFGEQWFTFPDLYRAAVLNANSPAHFVEVGSWKGRSSAFMCVEIFNSGKDIQFTCVDQWAGKLDKCDDCGAEVPFIMGCPDGAQICYECFDGGAH